VTAAPFQPTREIDTFSLFTPALPRPLSLSSVLLLAFRWLVVGCQVATLLITWPLWQVHDSPPMVPLVSLPAADLGIALLVSLAIVLIAPVPGLALHTLLLLYAIAIDQTRLQPEIVSLTFLMWGSLPNPTAKTFARAHLVSMWCFAGVNKLASPNFIDGTSQWMLSGLVSEPSPWLRDNVGYIIAFSEMGIGILALMPRTRKLAALAAFGLHTGILLDLSPRGHDWNEAVWPWNVALALAGFALIATWKEHPFRCVAICPAKLRPLLILLVIAPAGFYVGITDAYLAHNLYSSNTANATVRCARSCLPNQQPSSTWTAFNVPLPPEHRIFKNYFAESCRPGDVLTIRDTRWWYRRSGKDSVQFKCPTSG
jgi:hypothetical protein